MTTRRIVLPATGVTMTLDYVDGQTAVVLSPFPARDDGEEVVIVGDVDDLCSLSADLDSLLADAGD